MAGTVNEVVAVAKDSPGGLKVPAAAREMGVHVQAMREAAEGAPAAIKIVGEHGPERGPSRSC